MKLATALQQSVFSLLQTSGSKMHDDNCTDNERKLLKEYVCQQNSCEIPAVYNPRFSVTLFPWCANHIGSMLLVY